MEILEDSLSSESIADNLRTRLVGRRVLYFPSVTSTMDVAREEVRRGAPEGTAIVADEQTAGKGRIERVWRSPRGSIAVSVVLRPPMAYLTSLVMLAALAVVHSIENVTGLKAQIKWPNDVLIDGRKVCGILIESDVRMGKVNYATIGIGVNVNVRLNDYPELMKTAASLSGELGKEVSRLEIVRALLSEIDRLYLALLDGAPIYEQWQKRLVTLGRRVRVTSGETVLEGVAESVAPDGRLLVRLPDGSLTEVIAGDVTLRDAE